MVGLFLRNLPKKYGLMNRFGHCENYSFGLELETAIANAVQMSSTVLFSEIGRKPTGNYVFHSEFDNFNKRVNDLYGAGMINFAQGIMQQDIDSDEMPPEPTAYVPRTKERSSRYETDVKLPDCYVTQRDSPKLTIKQKKYDGSEEVFASSRKKNLLWIMLRHYSNRIPGWGGFVSITGNAPKRQTII